MTPQELYDELFFKVERGEISLEQLYAVSICVAATTSSVLRIPVLNPLVLFLRQKRKFKKDYKNYKDTNYEL